MGFDLNPFNPLIELGTKIIDKVIPDPEAKARANLELFKAQQEGSFRELEAQLQVSLAQVETNKIEAASESLFKSGWRPAVGWTCVSGLIYQLTFRPVFGWLGENLDQWTMPPALELETLLTLLFGMLGLGAYRTAEKKWGSTR